MHLQLDVHLLAALYVEDIHWGAAGADVAKDLGVCGVVVAVERAVVDAEAVGPEMQDAFDWGCGARGR